MVAAESGVLKERLSELETKVGGISVADFVENSAFKIPLMAGENGLDRVISRANVYADDDILDWVSPGEFLIMTELNARGWKRREWEAFASRGNELGLSAIGLKYNSENPKIPLYLRQIMDRLNFPLFIIPAEVPVADVSAEIFRQIFAHQREILQRHEKLNCALQNCNLERRGVSGLLDIMEESLKLPLAFLATDYREPELRSGGRKVDESLLLQDALAELSEHGSPALPRSVEVRIGNNRAWRLSVPVLIQNQSYGTLFCWSFWNRQDMLVLSVMEAVASNLALAMIQEYAVREVEIKHSSEIIEELLSDDRPSAAVDRAAVLKLRPNDDFCVILLKLEQVGETPESFDFYRYITTAIPWIKDVMEAHHLQGLLGQRQGYMEVILSRNGEKDDVVLEKRLLSFVQELILSLSARLPSSKLRLRSGVGRFHRGLENLRKSYAEAESSVQIGPRLMDDDIIVFDQLGIFKILIQKNIYEEIERFYHETLDPLLQYDAKKGTELIRTLDAYFENNSNINRTSEVLFTHYNTVLYRMERIREITGMDLNNPNDRLNLELALKVRKIYVETAE